MAQAATPIPDPHPQSLRVGPPAQRVLLKWRDDSHVLAAAVSSDEREIYWITREGDTYTCGCVGYSDFHKECRHIKAARASLQPGYGGAKQFCAGAECLNLVGREGDLCACCAASLEAFAENNLILASDGGALGSLHDRYGPAGQYDHLALRW